MLQPAPLDLQVRLGCPPDLPPPRLHLVRRPGRPYRLFPHRVRRTPPLAAGRRLRRPGRTLPVHAGPGVEPTRHGDRPAARRTARHARRLGRLHPALRPAHARLRLWRRGTRRCQQRRMAERTEAGRGGRGGAGGVGHGTEPGTGPSARDAGGRRRADRARDAIIVRPDRRHRARRHRRRDAAAEARRRQRPRPRAVRRDAASRRRCAGDHPVLRAAAVPAAARRHDRQPGAAAVRRVLSRRRPGVRRRPRGAAAAAGRGGADRLGRATTHSSRATVPRRRCPDRCSPSPPISAR